MIYTFDKFEDFQAKARELGITSDLEKLQNLDILFYEQYPEYMLFNLVSFESGINKIIILLKEDALIYPSLLFESDRILKIKVKGPYRESTIAAYTVLKKMSDNYYSYFEAINRELAHATDAPSSEKLEQLSRKLRRLQDIVDDFTALLIRLNESEVPFVDTKKIGYEFDILLARSRHLEHRCEVAKSDINMLYTRREMREGAELNKRLEKLTEVMKKLTAFTIILMLPTLLTSHYGMNFKFMPELDSPIGYPAVTIAGLLIMATTALYFRHKGWL
ncbi:MAG: CorA family divalent cation transporter [Candidatus Micrarchaeia archaeon]|jgi:magnesium transporter